MSDDRCVCGHLWTEHDRYEGCWNGWKHDSQGLAITDGCRCLLAHSRLSR